MTAKDVQRAIARPPFMPFVIHTTAGQEIPVFHPEAIWQAPEPDDDTVIIHVREVGIVFTDASGIADIVSVGKRTASAAG